jgi:hypothetical protein
VAAAVQWSVPHNASGIAFAREIAARLSLAKGPFAWFFRVYLLAKYGEPHEVLTASGQARKFHAKEPFFARQRMAVLSRALELNEWIVEKAWTTEVSSGTTDSASVASNMLRLLRSGFPNKNSRDHYYLFPRKQQRPYPLPKFLLLCAVARSEERAGRTTKRP